MSRRNARSDHEDAPRLAPVRATETVAAGSAILLLSVSADITNDPAEIAAHGRRDHA